VTDPARISVLQQWPALFTPLQAEHLLFFSLLIFGIVKSTDGEWLWLIGRDVDIPHILCLILWLASRVRVESSLTGASLDKTSFLKTRTASTKTKTVKKWSRGASRPRIEDKNTVF